MWLWAAFIVFVFFLVALDLGIFPPQASHNSVQGSADIERRVDRRRACLQCPHLLCL